MSHKSYPNKEHIRRQSRLACKAIHELADLGIEVLAVSFGSSNPKIEVSHCPATKKIKSALMGSGRCQQTGDHYVTRKSVFCGCQVQWQEVQP